MKLTYFLYTDIPAAGKNWTLAVLATGRKDADQYVRAVNGGGKFVGIVEQGTVKADCGAVTAAAESILANRR